MINFGRFDFDNVIIKGYEASQFTHSKFNKGKISYNLYLKKADSTEDETFFIILNDMEGFDLVHAERYSQKLHIMGDILKNPKTHKNIFVVNDHNDIHVKEDQE